MGELLELKNAQPLNRQAGVVRGSLQGFQVVLEALDGDARGGPHSANLILCGSEVLDDLQFNLFSTGHGG